MENSFIVLTLISVRGLLSLEDHAYAVAWVDPDVKHFTVVDSRGNTNDEWNAELILSVKQHQLQHFDAESVSIEIFTKSCLRDELLGRVSIGFTDFVRVLGGISERIYAVVDVFGVVQGNITISARAEGRSVADEMQGETVGFQFPNRRTDRRTASWVESLAEETDSNVDEVAYSASESQDCSLSSNDSGTQRQFRSRVESVGRQMRAYSTTTLTRTNSSSSEDDSLDSREKEHDLQQMPNTRTKWPFAEPTKSRAECLSVQPTKLERSSSFPHHERKSRNNGATSVLQPSESHAKSTPRASSLPPPRPDGATDKQLKVNQRQGSLPRKRRSTSGTAFSVPKGVVYQEAIAGLPSRVEQQEAHVDTRSTGRSVSETESGSETAEVDHYVASRTPYSADSSADGQARQSHQFKLGRKPQPSQRGSSSKLKRSSESLVASRVKQFEELIHSDGQDLHCCNTEKQRSELGLEKSHKEIANTTSPIDDLHVQAEMVEPSIPDRLCPEVEVAAAADPKQEGCLESKQGTSRKQQMHRPLAVDVSVKACTIEDEGSDGRLRQYGPQEQSWELSDGSSDGEDSVNDVKRGDEEVKRSAETTNRDEEGRNKLPSVRQLLRHESPKVSSDVGRQGGGASSKGWWACSCKLGRLCCCTCYTSS